MNDRIEVSLWLWLWLACRRSERQNRSLPVVVAVVGLVPQVVPRQQIDDMRTAVAAVEHAVSTKVSNASAFILCCA